MSLRIGRFLEAGPVHGEPLQVGTRRITPVAWTTVVRISMPRVPLAGGFIWTRPLAVEVQDSTGLRRIPILGSWMWIGLALAAAVFPVLLLGFLGAQRRKRQ